MLEHQRINDEPLDLSDLHLDAESHRLRGPAHSTPHESALIACTPRVRISWASTKARFGNSGTVTAAIPEHETYGQARAGDGQGAFLTP